MLVKKSAAIIMKFLNPPWFLTDNPTSR